MENLILISVSEHELKQIIEASVSKALKDQNSRSLIESDSAATIFSIEEAADFINLARTTIYALTSKNEIPFYKRGKKLYFKKKDLIEWLEKGKRKTNCEIQEEADQYLSKNRRR